MPWVIARRARSSSESGQTSAVSFSRVTPRSPARASSASRARRRGCAAAPATIPRSPRTQSVPNVMMRSVIGAGDVVVKAALGNAALHCARATSPAPDDARVATIAYANRCDGRRNRARRPRSATPFHRHLAMNAARKRLVTDSWEAIVRQHDRLAIAFYDRLFEIDPAARAMFAKTDMGAQRGKFLDMLGEIVRNLDSPKDLIPSVSALGKRHADYGVREIDYDRLREALLAALSAEAGAAFTEDVRDAWEEAYALTAGVMKRAAKTPES